jgi:hypothetical protein
MVMPRSRSSGALSMFAKSTAAPPCFGHHLGDRGGQRGLAVVDVTDGADVAVRLVPLEFFLRHFTLTFCLLSGFHGRGGAR